MSAVLYSRKIGERAFTKERDNKVVPRSLALVSVSAHVPSWLFSFFCPIFPLYFALPVWNLISIARDARKGSKKAEAQHAQKTASANRKP